MDDGADWIYWMSKKCDVVAVSGIDEKVGTVRVTNNGASSTNPPYIQKFFPSLRLLPCELHENFTLYIVTGRS